MGIGEGINSDTQEPKKKVPKNFSKKLVGIWISVQIDSEGVTYIKELDNIIRCLYEDRVTDRITPERYDTMAGGYEQEQASLREELQALNEQMNELDMREHYVNEFIAKAKEYIEMPQLTPELLRVFIRKIEVMEKTEKYSRTCGNTIIIHYTFEYPRQYATNPVNNEKTA